MKPSIVGTVLVSVACALLTSPLLGCAYIQKEEAKSTETLLAAAGFQIKWADTPQRLADLSGLEPNELTPQDRDGETYWVYADPKVCRCIYVGNQKNYSEYEKLKVKQQMVNEQEATAAMNQDASLNWGMWGPWGPWY